MPEIVFRKGETERDLLLLRFGYTTAISGLRFGAFRLDEDDGDIERFLCEDLLWLPGESALVWLGAWDAGLEGDRDLGLPEFLTIQVLL